MGYNTDLLMAKSSYGCSRKKEETGLIKTCSLEISLINFCSYFLDLQLYLWYSLDEAIWRVRKLVRNCIKKSYRKNESRFLLSIKKMKTKSSMTMLWQKENTSLCSEDTHKKINILKNILRHSKAFSFLCYSHIIRVVIWWIDRNNIS